jgi:hypothetical protein
LDENCHPIITPKFAVAGFRSTGISPFNPDVLSEPPLLSALSQNVSYTATSNETKKPLQEVKIRNGLQLIKKL